MRKTTLSAITLCALLALGLSACTKERAPAVDPVATPLDQPVEDVPPATAPATPAAPAAPAAPTSALARFDGYGDLRFGMSAAAAKQALAGALNGERRGEGCYHLTPASSPAPMYINFTIEGDKFVRYDVGNDTELAPGGGRRGMDTAGILRLYPGVEQQPHKYVDGGKYLRIRDPAGGSGAIVFETDAAGKVSEWRAGVAPQVDYVEGCS